MSDIVIETRGLAKTYTDFFGRPRHHALKGLDLEVRRGELFGLLGPNGSGKTTTIKLLLGLIRPTGGWSKILGREPNEVDHRKNLGFLPEESYFYDFLNADETMDFYGRLFGMPRAARRKKADELLAMVGLEHARRRPLKEYSKGMVRRVGLAQALINDPDLLILDEPTSGLDPIGTREFKDLLSSLRDQGKTILLCSHLLADVQELCSRLCMLYRGDKVLEGKLEDLLTVADVSEIQFRGVPGESQQKVEDAVRDAGGEVVSTGSARETLEQLFVRTVRERQAATSPSS